MYMMPTPIVKQICINISEIVTKMFSNYAVNISFKDTFKV